MKMRNVKAQSKEGQKKLSKGRDLTSGEMEQLYKVYKSEGIIQLMEDAYFMGVNVGIRQAKAQARIV